MNEIGFCFYGITVYLSSNSSEIVERIVNDFSFFILKDLRKESCTVKVIASLKEVNIDQYKRGFKKSRFFFRHTETYDLKKKRLNIYDNRLVSLYDFENEEGQVSGEDINLLHEVLYLLILSRVGKLHDQIGIHRLHAMFAQKKSKSLIGVGGSGVGKSTLLLNLCKSGLSFGSDDVTLINSAGEILPFPIRAGSGQKIEGLNYNYELKRRKFGIKYLYNLSENYNTANKTNKATFVLLERGDLGIKRASLYKRVVFITKYFVIGIGTPQIFEYFWECGLKDFLIKFRILTLRVLCAIKLLFLYDFFVLSTIDEKESARLALNFFVD